jgi:lambda family phage portal protein
MNLARKVLASIGLQPLRRVPLGASARAYAAARSSRLTADWTTTCLSGLEEVKGGLRTLRDRSRSLERDNDYWRHWLSIVVRNVIGPDGIRLQLKAKLADGTLDTAANSEIEAAWRDWGKLGTCTVDGRKSWLDVQRLWARSIARDGECLIRLVRGYPNRYGFALQVIEADLLDEQLNDTRGAMDGSGIKAGVEVDRWQRPVAYWLRQTHPGDMTQVFRGKLYIRVPADEILHGYREEREGQTRGVPWGCSAMARLQMLAGYEEAELVAARAAAAKMGFYEQEDIEVGDDGEVDGKLVTDFAPGTWEKLPPGVKAHLVDPTHPGGNAATYVKSCLRGIASGVDVSYNRLANDLEGVTYSSLRSGELDERDVWRMEHSYNQEHLSAPTFSAWLPMYLLSGLSSLPMADLSRLSADTWQCRSWTWVDPRADVTAKREAIAAGWMTDTEAAAELGNDYEDVCRTKAAEAKLRAETGVPDNAQDQAAAPGSRPAA